MHPGKKNLRPFGLEYNPLKNMTRYDVIRKMSEHIERITSSNISSENINHLSAAYEAFGQKLPIGHDPYLSEKAAKIRDRIINLASDSRNPEVIIILEKVIDIPNRASHLNLALRAIKALAPKLSKEPVKKRVLKKLETISNRGNEATSKLAKEAMAAINQQN